MNTKDVRRLVREAIKAEGGVRALSRKWKVSPAMLTQLVKGKVGPGPKILGPLGLKRVEQTFEKATA